MGRWLTIALGVAVGLTGCFVTFFTELIVHEKLHFIAHIIEEYEGESGARFLFYTLCTRVGFPAAEETEDGRKASWDRSCVCRERNQERTKRPAGGRGEGPSSENLPFATSLDPYVSSCLPARPHKVTGLFAAAYPPDFFQLVPVNTS